MTFTAVEGRRAAVLFLAFSSAIGPARADDLVVNGRFDANVIGWAHSDGAVVAHQTGTGFDADANGCLTSGSARFVHAADATGSMQVAIMSRCLGEVAPETEHQFGGHLYFPEAQLATGLAQVAVNWYSDTGCDDILSSTAIGGIDSTQDDQWWPRAIFVTSPAETGSADIHVTFFKDEDAVNGDEDLAVLVDNLFFRPAEDVFEDGFEVGSGGDHCRWSLVAP